ncbi:hypothetical protein GCM10022288_10580 [Gryllotalpicola kribbensis]|uniref:Transposase n=1 Tax=Gryllotalpicola kribbensis TaxID=993084 RepID=A0ABP8AN69_9MICO
MLVTEVLGQLGIQSRFEDVLRELAEQATGPCQAHALFFRLRQQPLCKFLLVDDLPGHRINHLVISDDVGRVSHGHLLTDQAGPSHTVFLTSMLVWRRGGRDPKSDWRSAGPPMD